MTTSLIAKTAKEIAGAFWEDTHSDRFRKFWPNVDVYINRNWTTYVDTAREILAGMLGRPDVTDKQKEEIFAALEEDMAEQTAKGKPRKSQETPPLSLNPEHPGTIERKLFH